MKTIFLGIDGMKCGMCEAHVNDAVRRVEKVKKVSSYHTKKQTEIVAEDDVNVDDICASITKLGYQITSVDVSEHEKKGLFGKSKNK